MSILHKRKRSLDDCGQLQHELSSDQTIVPPRQEPSHVFSNISASDHSHQHVGHVYCTTNVNLANPGDGAAKRIIDSLYFPDIEKRRDAIGVPADGTYEWLLRPESPALEAIAEARNLWEDNGSGASSEDGLLISNENGVSISEEDQTATDNEDEIPIDDELEEEGEERRRYGLSEEAATKLTAWLQAKEGMFWIVGQAASGKSTLVKYLRNSSKVSQLLMEWTNGSPLVVADYYFWHSGSELQKSHEGLYRSLLWQIFRSDDRLVGIAWPRRVESSLPTSLPSGKDFREAMANLSAHGTKLCLFVDGLDEFYPQNDLDLLLDTFTSLAQLSNVKICASCRPWQVFAEHLDKTQFKIQLEHVNWIDIETYAAKIIRRHLRQSVLKPEFQTPLAPKGARFIQDIVYRSHGVFLWAHLALQRLAPRIQFANDIGDLEKFLTQFPPELESYFKDLIYERIHPTWKDSETAATLSFKLAGCDNIGDYWPLVTGRALSDAQFGITRDVCFSPDSWFETQLKRTTHFINECCADLLKVQYAPLRDPSCKINYTLWLDADVVYTHRTVHDFLQTETMAALIREHTPRHFHDLGHLYAQAKLTLMKMMPPKKAPWVEHIVLFEVVQQLIFRDWDKVWVEEDPLVLQECEHAIMKFVGASTMDSSTQPRGDHEENLSGHCRDGGGDDSSLVGLPLELVLRWSGPVLWRFAFSGLYSFARQLAQLGSLNVELAVTITEGCLGVGNMLANMIEDRNENGEALDFRFPLINLSISSIETGLSFSKGPNEAGHANHVSDPLIPSPLSYKKNGRTIWHEFLFKWWRLDPRRTWGCYVLDFDFEDEEETAVVTKPQQCTLQLLRLQNLAEPESSRIWEIAKFLIAAEADLRGPMCLTEWHCSQLLAEHEDGETYEQACRDYRMHTTDACWKLDVADVLRALVPDTGFDELEQLLEKAGQEL